MRKLIVLVATIIVTDISVSAQSRIPAEYRGTQEAIARGILDGNAIQTNFRNHGEHSRWGDIPWGIWPKDIGGRHIDGFGFFMAAKVPGERAKWSEYYGEGVSDTTLNPVIINYRQAGLRQSPYSGDIRGWLPLNGFNNENRTDDLGQKHLIPASSDDKTTWPEKWANRLQETEPGWPDSWNGYRGRGLVTGDKETFYVMDDFSDLEYAFGIEVDGPHSERGVYHPSPSDSTIGGLGLQVEVRHFQFNNVLADGMLFSQYRTTNVSEKDLDSVWTGMIMDIGLGFEENDDFMEFISYQNLFVFFDQDGIGEPTFGSSYELGYIGLLLLEYSTTEDNKIDEDQDGIIDESKFNGPGELIEGKAAIDAYLEANYNMELFLRKHISLEEFPAYQNERWWTGDEDLDWVAFDDHISNGVRDEEEDLIDDVGRDGLGPNHENYPGPDEGEGDGIPTQGEPNFGELDMLEAEHSQSISFWDPSTRPIYESGDNLRDDTWLFGKIKESQFEENSSSPDPVNPGEEPFLLAGTGPYSLKQNTSSYFTIALIFGEDREDLMSKVQTARTIYESDYGQSKLLTSNEEEFVTPIPNRISLFQNYPNPFNPGTTIEFSLTKTAPVSLTVFDITGREVQSLISNTSYSAGTHSVQFDAGNLSSGVYIYQLEAGGEVFTKKLTLIK